MRNEIEELLNENGAMGVNAIAQALGKPVSTMQKWLERQDYFVKTSNRRWDLAERVIETIEQKGGSSNSTGREALLIIENLTTQLDSAKLRLGVLSSIVSQTVTTSPNRNQGVAIPSILRKFINNVEQMRRGVKEHLTNVPDEYKDLLSNLDYLKLSLAKGAEFINNEIMPELTSLIIGEKTELEESTIELFKSYQIGQKKPSNTVPDSETTS